MTFGQVFRPIMVIGALALAACNENATRPPPAPLPAQHAFDLQGWHATYSPGVVVRDGAFDIPQAPETLGANSIHYLVRPSMGAASASTRLRATFTVETTGTPSFQFKLNPDNTCDGPPASAYLYLQRSGDDMQGKTGGTEFYRWFSDAGSQLAAGDHVLEVSFAADRWVSVMGKTSDVAPAMLNAALANLQTVGLTFGGGCFKGHGVNLRPGSGTAHFALQGFELK